MTKCAEEINFWIVWVTVLVLLMLSSMQCFKAQEKINVDFKPQPVFTPQVSEEIRPIATVQRQGYPTYLFTIFFPEFLYIKETQLPKENAIEFWNRVASRDACNGTRIFIGHTSWAGKYEQWIEKPFLIKDNKFLLPSLDENIEDYINPEWKRLLLERLKILRYREIFRSIDIWDFCQMHYRTNCSWDTHWLRQIDSDPHQAFNIHSATFKYVEKFTRYIVKLIWQEEVKHKRPGWNTSMGFNPGNESLPSKKWHDRIIEIIDQEIAKITPNVKMYRWQKLCSALPYENLHLGIDDKCLYQLHQVDSLETYNRLKREIVVFRFMASLDGARNKEGEYFLINKFEALKLIDQIIKDRNFGLELRVGHGEAGRLPSEANKWKYNLNVIDLSVPCTVVSEYRSIVSY
jgi:hypothetical protein